MYHKQYISSAVPREHVGKLIAYFLIAERKGIKEGSRSSVEQKKEKKKKG